MTRELIERFVEQLERSAGVEGAHIDFDDCAELAAAIRADRQSLSERIDVLEEMVSMFVDAAKPRGPDGHHEMPRFSAREIDIARASLDPDNAQR